MPEIKFTHRQVKHDKKYLEQVRQNFESHPDEYWIGIIHNYLFDFFNQCNKTDFLSLGEKAITRIIREWLNSNDDFIYFNVNREPENENELLIGQYDLKFDNKLIWENYYAIECKLMDETETQLKEYIYNPTKKKKGEPYPDGGVYRFLINKYAQNLTYGGMLGYVQKGDVQQIITTIKQRLTELEITLESGKKFGQLTDKKLLDEKIQDKDYTFQSKHVRCNLNSNQIIAPIHLHHILFDFTK